MKIQSNIPIPQEANMQHTPEIIILAQHQPVRQLNNDAVQINKQFVKTRDEIKPAFLVAVSVEIDSLTSEAEAIRIATMFSRVIDVGTRESTLESRLISAITGKEANG